MSSPVPDRRRLLGALALTAAVSFAGPAAAQETPIKFQLDWRYECPAALFLVPLAKGYFRQEKLDVAVDAGNGSGQETGCPGVRRGAQGVADLRQGQRHRQRRLDLDGMGASMMRRCGSVRSSHC